MNKTEPSKLPQTAPDADALAWLDGLAGRATVGDDGAQGATLRDALMWEDAPIQTAPWSEIERRAKRQPNNAEASAANDNRFLRRAGGALFALVLAVGVVSTVYWRDGADESQTLRGVGTSEALWRTPNPAVSGDALAADLRALGAIVQVSEVPAGRRLQIQAPATAQEGVNQRLMLLETALDAHGRLTLLVLAPVVVP